MKKIIAALGFLALMQSSVQGQRPGPKSEQIPGQKQDSSASNSLKKDVPPAKTGPKAYADVITKKAVSHKGVFTVHSLDDKYYLTSPTTYWVENYWLSPAI